MAMVMVLDDVVVIEEEEPTGDVLGERWESEWGKGAVNMDLIKGDDRVRGGLD